MPKISSSLLALLLVTAGIASAQPNSTASGENGNAQETATERRPGAVDTTGPGGMVGSENAMQAPSSGASGNSQDCVPTQQNQGAGAAQAGSECAEAGSSGSSSSATHTDSQPIGSETKADGPLSESEYPVSPGSGSTGSGSTGAPAGPSSGPTLGIGR